MLRDYIGLREKEEKRERKREERAWLLGGLWLYVMPASAGAAGVPRLKFHSQVAHRADLLTAGMCGLCPPAPSLGLIPRWLPQDPRMTEAPAAWDGGSWGGQGSFLRSVRASQFPKSSVFQSRADPYVEIWHCYDSNKSLIGKLGKNEQ